MALALTAALALAFLLVPAAQALASGSLKVNVNGTGKGVVKAGAYPALGGVGTGEPPVECSYESPGPATGTCTVAMPPVEVFGGLELVILHTAPAAGSEMVSWTLEKGEAIGETCASGPKNQAEKEATENAEGIEPGERICEILPDASGEAEVTATFTKQNLVVEKFGEGTVVSSPAGIECGTECGHHFEPETSVTLTASPAAGWAFLSWGGTGCATKVGLTCTLTTSASEVKKVKATFVKTWPLSVEKSGNGTGKVAATGISCDPGCTTAASAVKTGSKVKVSAVLVGKASRFAGFESGSGNASSCSASPCEFTITEASSLKANFELIPTNKLTVNLTGPAAGKGIVKSMAPNPGIACSAGCTSATREFLETAEVELSASAPTGYSFVKWTGACTGSGACKVPMNAGNKTVTAEFK